jgi:alpha-ketoglutaric semialdehyde dehydrogenase
MPAMEILGKSLIGFCDSTSTAGPFNAWNPATGERIDTTFSSVSPEDVERAASIASEAFSSYSRLSGRERASFLNLIASRLESIADLLVARAHNETALPEPRLKSETARTCNQLRLFASVLEEGSWVSARIDRADPQRKPLPKPDIRSLLHALGPVVVFGASNFPLAFSVAGGDTTSALAAGNPVIVKAHPAHPGTSELAGRAIRDCVREQGLPEGVFSLLFDSATEVGAKLVQHPLVKAVGFTGSIPAGRALMDLAVRRPEPIPFYGEMGSTNPVFILPGAMAARGQDIASELHGSFTLGSGQFCTKPGLVFLPQQDSSSNFLLEFQDKVVHSPKYTLLTSGIRNSYQREIQNRKGRSNLALVAQGEQPASSLAFLAGVAVFQTEVSSLLSSPDLGSEVFGPSTLLVHFSNRADLLDAARSLSGHLTATIHGTEEDLREFSDLLQILKHKVGRIVFNGYPTGVEVCHAMVHGGPYPASTDSRTTSVGSQAIFRFARPVCYQDFPDSALPAELKNSNPLGIFRMVDGEFTRRQL